MSAVEIDRVLVGFAAMSHPAVVVAVARELKRPLLTDQRAHARAQESPEGKWPKRKLGGGRRRVLGKLPAAVVAKVSGSTVSVVSRVPWSGAHQDGPTRVGHGAIVPSRQFLWISDGMIGLASDAIARAAVREF